MSNIDPCSTKTSAFPQNETIERFWQTLADIGPCADLAVDGAILERIIHKFSTNRRHRALGMTPAQKRAIMPLWTEARFADHVSDNLNWIHPMCSLPRMARHLPTQSMSRGRDLTWRVRMQLSRGHLMHNRRILKPCPNG
jgi:hypothetical protein